PTVFIKGLVNITLNIIFFFFKQKTAYVMDGMSVTATWINSSGTIFTNTQAWADLPGSPSNDGGVRFVNNSGNNDFTLEVSGDTFDSNNWDLEFYISGASSRLLSLDFDGTTGRTVFDICDGNAYCQSNPY